ncbi:MAG: hypothetical protein IKD45_02765 [Clostridia bacterium]|nr:hypothetical protein [Clostridia bacterium]
MNKRITGEDILTAIGGISERLLDVPTRAERQRGFIKGITVAASIVISLSLIFTWYFNLVMRGAHSSDPNFSPDKEEGGMSSGSADNDFSDVTLAEYITVSPRGELDLPSGSPISKDTHGFMTVICKIEGDIRPTASVGGEPLPYTDEGENRIFRLRGNAELHLSSESFEGDVIIIVTEYSDHYEFKLK